MVYPSEHLEVGPCFRPGHRSGSRRGGGRRFSHPLLRQAAGAERRPRHPSAAPGGRRVRWVVWVGKDGETRGKSWENLGKSMKISGKGGKIDEDLN